MGCSIANGWSSECCRCWRCFKLDGRRFCEPAAEQDWGLCSFPEVSEESAVSLVDASVCKTSCSSVNSFVINSLVAASIPFGIQEPLTPQRWSICSAGDAMASVLPAIGFHCISCTLTFLDFSCHARRSLELLRMACRPDLPSCSRSI